MSPIPANCGVLGLCPTVRIWPSRLQLRPKSSLQAATDNLNLDIVYVFSRVQNTHHKFMRASYMKHFAKFLAILHHNASFFNFCFIINFGFNKNLLHIFEILKNYCCLCLRSLYCWLSLPRVVRFSIIFGSPQMQIICYYNAWLGKCLS